jgi:hypothetical protein
MTTDNPKLMLKVELINQTDVRFTLLLISNLFKNKITGSKFLFTNNGWTIYHSKNFSISKKGVISLPESCLRQQNRLSFKNNEERYIFMKNMVNALEYWSGSYLFTVKNKTNKVKINFHKKIWIIF